MLIYEKKPCHKFNRSYKKPLPIISTVFKPDPPPNPPPGKLLSKVSPLRIKCYGRYL